MLNCTVREATFIMSALILMGCGWGVEAFLTMVMGGDVYFCTVLVGAGWGAFFSSGWGLVTH